MKIKSVTYLGSFGHEQPFPGARGPEIVFLGRSNVGKSSLINTLLGRRNIARTSNTPGKTRTANYYLVDERFCFVDMPGYGYAQRSKTERAQWKKLIRSYLEERDELRGIVQLLDVRHPPSDADKETARLARKTGKRVCLAFNKVDKIKKGSADVKIAGHLQMLAVAHDTAVVPFSSETGEGKRELWAWIADSFGFDSAF
ncbi:MAG: YihA family ribosome biogenesis GTP-binding protein [Candidatus Latescibacterota bacterium]|nr:MAG: YihA family ribosome biogenesis GTP-binding protein [Candidatus Latescibacterota bacterium]